MPNKNRTFSINWINNNSKSSNLNKTENPKKRLIFSFIHTSIHPFTLCVLKTVKIVNSNDVHECMFGLQKQAIPCESDCSCQQNFQSRLENKSEEDLPIVGWLTSTSKLTGQKLFFLERIPYSMVLIEMLFNLAPFDSTRHSSTSQNLPRQNTVSLDMAQHKFVNRWIMTLSFRRKTICSFFLPNFFGCLIDFFAKDFYLFIVAVCSLQLISEWTNGEKYKNKTIS